MITNQGLRLCVRLSSQEAETVHVSSSSPHFQPRPLRTFSKFSVVCDNFPHYRHVCSLAFTHKWLVSPWHVATNNASLCGSSRWVIYAWRWAPKASLSPCHLPSARLGRWCDINPSQMPSPSPTNFSFLCFPNLETCWIFLPGDDWIHLSPAPAPSRSTVK